MGFSNEEKELVKGWLLDAFQAASAFDGSEPSELSENMFYDPLDLFDSFCRAKNDGEQSNDMETKIARLALPDGNVNVPTDINGFLDAIPKFYEQLTSVDIMQTLKDCGAVVNESDKVFVKTDDGKLKGGVSPNPQSYKVRTEPRLAMLIAHLRNDGVNGTPIYMDDLAVTRGEVSKDMMREHPYNIVQIPRIDMEIAVCEQIGETTFVKQGCIDEKFWAYLSKDELKARDDVLDVTRHNDVQWWSEISSFLSGNAKPEEKKVNVKSWNNKKKNLDRELIKESLLAHYLATGEVLKPHNKAKGGKVGSYSSLN